MNKWVLDEITREKIKPLLSEYFDKYEVMLWQIH